MPGSKDPARSARGKDPTSSPTSAHDARTSLSDAERRARELLDDAWRHVKPILKREKTDEQPSSELLNLRLR